MGAVVHDQEAERLSAEPPHDHGGSPPDHEHHGPHGHGGHHGPSPLRRLLSILRPEVPEIRTVVIFALGVGMLSLAVPMTVDSLISNVQGGNTAMTQAVVVLSGVLLFCLLLAGAMRAWQTYLVELIQRRIFVRVTGQLAYRLPRVRAAAFDRAHGPELVNRFFDVLTVQKASATLLLDGVVVVIQAAVGLVLLAVWHPWLLGYNVLLLAATTLIVVALGWNGVSAKIRESYAKYGVAGWLEEMVRHPLTFKMEAAQKYAMQRADNLAHEYLVARTGAFRVFFRQLIFGIALQAFATAALLGMGGWLVIRNELTIGQLVAAELIVVVVVGSFVKLGKSLESFYDLMAAVDKLGHLTDLPLEREAGDRFPHSGKGEPAALRVKNLHFAYDDSGPNHEIICGLAFQVEPGQRVAITGGSGTGKSTMAELLFGLREPTSGVIELDGVDVRDIQLEDLRKQVASIAGGEVFDGTVLDNVRMGREALSLADIRQALETAGLLEEIQALPHGLNTPLATGGAPLSKGQIQRLMLARALVGKPRLLILDETLDGLDTEKRNRIIQRLFAHRGEWTVLAITHNQEVVAACDRVLPMQPGSGH